MFKNSKYFLAFNLFIFLAFFYTLIIIFLYLQQQQFIETESSVTANKQLLNLKDVLEVYGLKRNQLIQNYLSNVRQILESKGVIEEQRENTLQIEIRNQLTQEIINEEVVQWKLGNEQLQFNYGLLDEILFKTTCPMAIFQKIDKGFIRVGVTQNELINAVVGYTFIPNSAEAAFVLESGAIHTEKTNVAGKEFLAIHQPLIVDKKVKGALVLSVRDDYLQILQKLYPPTTSQTTNFLYGIDKKGIVVLHPHHVGLNMRMAEPNFWKYLKKNTANFYNAPVAYLLKGKKQTTWQYIFYDKNTQNYWIIQQDNTPLLDRNFYQHLQILGIGYLLLGIISLLFHYLFDKRLKKLLYLETQTL